MALELRQSLKLSQQLVMTPQLQQAIKLLQLSRLELAETINQELLENPLLDEAEETLQDNQQVESEAGAGPANEDSLPNDENGEDPAEAGDPGGKEDGGEPADDEVQMDDQVKEDFDWENYLGDYSSAGSGYESVMREDHEAPAWESMTSSPTSLKDHLLWQLSMSELDGHQRRVSEVLVEALNPDGYLTPSLDEIAQTAGVETELVERVLAVVQQLDPLGVGARDLRECLVIQATEIYPANDLVHDIIENHLGDLETRRYKAITKKLKVDMDQVAEALAVIRTLEPKPGRAFNDEPPQYITPDIYVYKIDGEFVIVLNEDGLPRLRVNNSYKEALAKGGDAEAKEYVKDKLRSAMWLIRSIHQRQRTIYKVTESIIKFQEEFFDKGIAHLKPLVLRDVAEDVDMHESTISRVTTNKYVHTPQGVFELKYFFNSSINRFQGRAMASEAVKDRIGRIIREENQAKPLSDQAIAAILKEEDIDIARRTVAKYRESLGILPSSRRRQPLKALHKGHKKKAIDKIELRR